MVLGAILSTLSFEYKFITSKFLRICPNLKFSFRLHFFEWFLVLVSVENIHYQPLLHQNLPLRSPEVTLHTAFLIFTGRMVSAVFSMQGIGSLIASLVGLILIIALKDNFELMWRLALGKFSKFKNSRSS